MRFKTFLRRLRAEQSRLIWKWSRVTRKTPKNLTALQSAIDSAARSHKPRAHLVAELRDARHAHMKQGLPQ
jgi:hypothetical protein